MHAEAAGGDISATRVLQSARWHWTGHGPWPSTYDKWEYLPGARGCRWRLWVEMLVGPSAGLCWLCRANRMTAFPWLWLICGALDRLSMTQTHYTVHRTTLVISRRFSQAFFCLSYSAWMKNKNVLNDITNKYSNKTQKHHKHLVA